MPTLQLTCPIANSFRVAKVAGMFDVPIADKATETIEYEAPPPLYGEWKLGAIVGPSGSGKSSVARELYGDFVYKAERWPSGKAVIDAITQREDLEVKKICALLTAVGFSSPPAWVKPYEVLSNGQQFRCDLARSLLTKKPVVAFDEFTSVVDRTVARVGSAAVAKAVRRQAEKKFIAVTCHYDVLEWLEPDWVLDMASGKLARGSLRRPEIRVDICQGKRAAWPTFAKHHYLSANLPGACRCYYATATIGDSTLAPGESPGAGAAQAQLVGFVATAAQLGNKHSRRISRIVILPDWQGVGIGQRLLDSVAELEAAQGFRVGITTSHPSMIGYLDRSPRWRVFKLQIGGQKNSGIVKRLKGTNQAYTTSAGRAVVSAVFLGSG
jgi:ABC-type polar amino acid transport system ATPase subunit